MIDKNQTKKCGICKNEFPKTFDHFYKNGNRLDPWCKSCRKEYVSAYNKKNRNMQLLGEQSRREKTRLWLESYRLPCVKCGEKRTYLIEFHHTDPTTKSFEVLNNLARSNKVLLKEIKKCITLCCNCHREFHYFERLNQISINEYLQ